MALVSALSSPRRATTLDAARVLLLTALLLPLGGSRVLEKYKALLLSVFLVVAAFDTGVSVLQARGLYTPSRSVTPGAREGTGAFVGKRRLPGAGSGARRGLLPRRPPLRRPCGTARRGRAGFPVLRGRPSRQSQPDLLVGAGGRGGDSVVCRDGRRAAPGIALLLLLAAVGAFAYRPLRHRARGNRVGPPGPGLGPPRDVPARALERRGRYGARASLDRVRAGHVRGGVRAAPPPRARSACAAGSSIRWSRLLCRGALRLPAGLRGDGDPRAASPFSRLSLSSSVTSEGPRATRHDPGSAPRRSSLLAFLGAGAVAALTWFPLQRPISAIPLLLAAGRAWRIGNRRPVPGAPEPRTAKPEHRLLPIARGLVLVGALVWVLAPELPRYRAERQLRPATESLRYLVTHPGEFSDPRTTLDHIEEFALSAVPGLPGDSRPLVLAGSCRLVGADAAGALAVLSQGSRPRRAGRDRPQPGRAYEAAGESERPPPPSCARCGSARRSPRRCCRTCRRRCASVRSSWRSSSATGACPPRPRFP